MSDTVPGVSSDAAPHARATRTVTDQLRLLIEEQTDYAIFLLDPSGHIASWNAGAARLKGYRADEIIGRHFSIFYTDDAVARDHPAHELEIAAREGRYEEEGWRLRKDGSRFWANVVITALREGGELIGYGKVTRDLTSRRLAEEQLRAMATDLEGANARLEEFRTLVSGVRDYAIFMLDAGGHVRTWNPGAEKLKGYTETEIVGRHFSLFYPPEDREQKLPGRALEIAARKGRFVHEGWRVRKDGTRFWADVLITALRNQYGTLVGFAKITRDLTERREAEQELRRTAEELRRANAELDAFASLAAHDLVEPLHTIAGMAELVAHRYGPQLGDDGRLLLGEITGGARRMDARIDALLRYARAGRGEIRRVPVRLSTAVAEAVSGLHGLVRERDARIVFDEAMPVVLADPALLDSVLQNFLSNAIKFTEGPAPRVDVTAEPAQAGVVRISIRDRGVGIAPEHRDRIFAAFKRLHSADEVPGTGIGLALCERLVRRQGGELGVDSTPGAGSRFWFTLPEAR
jgi:PAS domain S-box-containing protein